MAVFDVSKKWRILAPSSSLVAWNAADELAGYISLLRGRTGLDCRPVTEDAEKVSPPEDVPVIILNAAAESRDRSGFSWRFGRNRIEITGDSSRGLWNGVFDFLAALGVRWPKPGQEALPAPPSPDVYPLQNDRGYHPSAAVQNRRRLVISEAARTKEREQLVRWAARNQYDALVFSLGEGSLWNRMRRSKGIYHVTERYALILEAGGADLSLLLPRHLFLLHPDMFRMDSGVRVRQRHFCPTNPKTIAQVKKQTAKLFSRAMAGMNAQAVPVFHLWPDSGHAKTWCACPACRAFSPAEQNRIAVNTAADILADINPLARLSYFEEAPEAEAGGQSADAAVSGGIAPRSNTFVIG
jgi:hypothetical protein